MVLMGIDIGTTHSKVGLFELDGDTITTASSATTTHHHREGFAYYEPEDMWETVVALIKRVTDQVPNRQVTAIGITSMAESGLLVDQQTGEPRSHFLPWFDSCSSEQAAHISAQSDALERFSHSGLHNSFKLGLAKMLWIRERDPEAMDRSIWLSASSYIAYRLTGKMAFDYSLAARTYAFSLPNKAWDQAWLNHFGLSTSLFPDVLSSTTVMGHVQTGLSSLQVKAGTPVVIAGHDHVCSALAVGAITTELVYDSMGTAETLVGTLHDRPLGQQEFESGLSYGVHIAPERLFWMGGNSSSGGSVEWLRTLLGDPQLSYEQILALLDQTDAAPTGMLYYPYLSGSGAPQRDSAAKASLIGMTNAHSKGDIIKAVLEGTAYQLESIRRSVQAITGRDIKEMLVVGGGTRNKHWLQIKADVSNCILELPHIPEASLLGAAMAAGVGQGAYASVKEAVGSLAKTQSRWILPDEEQHARYRQLYEQGFEQLQAPLRAFFDV